MNPISTTHRPYLFEGKIPPLSCVSIILLLPVNYANDPKLASTPHIPMFLPTTQAMSAHLSKYITTYSEPPRAVPEPVAPELRPPGPAIPPRSLSLSRSSSARLAYPRREYRALCFDMLSTRIAPRSLSLSRSSSARLVCPRRVNRPIIPAPSSGP